MKKQIIMSLTILLIVSSISVVSADFWACFSKGDKINFCNPSVPDRTASSDGYTICMKEYDEENQCYIQGSVGKCNENGACVDIGGTEIDGEPPELTLNSPTQDGLYISRSVLLDFEVNEMASVYYKDNSDDRGRWTRVCSGCEEYSRNRRFNEGMNDITFKAVDVVGLEVYQNVTFLVDSKSPKIHRTLPRRGFASGLFEIEFDEENPDEIWMNYGNSDIGWRNYKVNLGDCSMDRFWHCTSEVDLSDYNGQDIEYWFNITDIVKNYDESRRIELSVDTVSPIINSAKYHSNGRNEIIVNVTENYLEGVEYMDNYDERADWRNLCRRFDRDDGLCHGVVRLDDGLHNITLKAMDEAGHETFYEMDEFFTDSKYPRIYKALPRSGYASGFFEVQYTELNVKNINITYGNYLSGFMTEDLTGCNSGKKEWCDIDVDLSLYDGQEIEYYFTVEDIVGNVEESRVTDVDVDTTFPVLNNPDSFWEQGGSGRYNRYIYFVFNVTEDNLDEISYYDWEDRSPRWKRLCTQLDDEGICEKRKSFRNGNHVLDIQITDEAGNAISTERVEFEVDY